MIARIEGRLLAVALLCALAACGSSDRSAQSSGSPDPCDATGIAGAIDAASASSGSPAQRGDQLDDLISGIVQCEAQSATAPNDPKDPLNLQLARANLAAGKAYAQAGKKTEATHYLATAAFTAKFIGNAALESEAQAALKQAR